MSGFTVRALTASDWELLRSARVAALTDSPESFGGDPDEEAAWPRERWTDSLVEARWGIATEPSGPIALLGVRPAADAYDCDCWISSWWVAPSARGQGASDALLEWVDELCLTQGWQRQGLGVWAENQRAQAAFARLGFVVDGDPRPSTHFPGRWYVRMLRSVPEPRT